ncbi:MAG: biopolymer transporter ExbD [Blastopirellula sp.]|nr:MAG: biopolymer transporter ExbD [Blastopirellula sp.]
MAVKIKKSSALVALNITPLIDIVFLLLIFFMVMSRFEDEDNKLDVTLPSASEAKPLISKPSEVFINIDLEGKYYVSGAYMTLAEVEQVLRQASADNPESAVIIRADKRSRIDAAVQIMNACNKMGLPNYSLTTSPNKG